VVKTDYSLHLRNNLCRAKSLIFGTLSSVTINNLTHGDFARIWCKNIQMFTIESKENMTVRTLTELVVAWRGGKLDDV
jgi:hypothetical protein